MVYQEELRVQYSRMDEALRQEVTPWTIDRRVVDLEGEEFAFRLLRAQCYRTQVSYLRGKRLVNHSSFGNLRLRRINSSKEIVW